MLRVPNGTYWFALAAFLLSALPVFAQTHLDSLFSEFRSAKSDTFRINRENRIAAELSFLGLADSSLYFSNKALEDAKAIHYEAGTADAYNNIGVILESKGENKKSMENYELALKIRMALHDSSGLASLYSNMGNVFGEQNNSEKALDCFNKALELRKGSDDKKGIATVFNNIGNLYRKLGDYKTALDYFTRSFGLRKEINDRKGLASSLHNMGLIHFNLGDYALSNEELLQSLAIKKEMHDVRSLALTYNALGNNCSDLGDYPKAIAYLLEALKINEQLSNKKGIAVSLINIARVYSEQDMFDKATEYYMRALSIKQELDDKQGVSIVLNNVASIYTQQKDYDKALDFAQRSLVIRKTTGDKKGMAAVFDNLANIYFCKLMTDSALANAFYSLRIRRAIGDQIGTASSLNNLGRIYTYKKNYPEAITALKEAESIEKNIHALASLQTTYEYLAKNYAAQQNYEKAYQYEVVMARLDSMLMSSERQKSIADMQTKYETVKKEKEITLLQKDQSIKELQLSKQESDLFRQRIIILFSLLFVLLLGILSLYIYRGLQQKKKSNLLLKKKNNEISIQRDIIQKKNIQITDSITYALTIQESFLPSPAMFRESFPDYFIFYQPKDIVSGDFYWIRSLGEQVLIAAVDCTGHGVPGAFMSLHGYNHLENIVHEKKVHTPGRILDELNKAVMETLHQDDGSDIAKHGMDMSLVKLDRDKGKIYFSGAKNSALIFSNGALTELKADRISVGNKFGKDFSEQHMNVQKGDMIYLFSDGYVDQKGGAGSKRFLMGPFKELLSKNAVFPCEEQKRNIHEVYLSWKGEQEQIDDVMVVGIRV